MMEKHKIILVPFPFDDFSELKVRPAAVCLTNSIGKHKSAMRLIDLQINFYQNTNIALIGSIIAGYRTKQGHLFEEIALAIIELVDPASQEPLNTSALTTGQPNKSRL